MQINLVTVAPINLIEIKIFLTVAWIKGNSVIIRIKPYPPSFRRIPARIIDPATGASTCALGSHRCVVYRGIFTINAIIKINDVGRGKELNVVCIIIGIKNLVWLLVENISLIRIRSGSLAVIVYIIK